MYTIHVFIDCAELRLDDEWVIIKPTHSFEEGFAWAAKFYPRIPVI